MVGSLEGREGFLLGGEIFEVRGVKERAVNLVESGLLTSVVLPLPQVDLVQELLGEVNNLQLVIYRERQERGEVKARRGLVLATAGCREDEDQLELWFNQSLRERGRGEVEEISHQNDQIVFRLKGEEGWRDFDWMWGALRITPTAEAEEPTPPAREMTKEEIRQWLRTHRGGKGKTVKEAVEMFIESDEESREG